MRPDNCPPSTFHVPLLGKDHADNHRPSAANRFRLPAARHGRQRRAAGICRQPRRATPRRSRAGHHPGRQTAGLREPQGTPVPQGSHGTGPAALRGHAREHRSRRSGPAAEPAGPHRPGEERHAQGRRPVRRLPLQPQTRPRRAGGLGRGKRPAESRLQPRYPGRQPQPGRQDGRGVDRPGAQRGPRGQPGHDHGTVRR